MKKSKNNKKSPKLGTEEKLQNEINESKNKEEEHCESEKHRKENPKEKMVPSISEEVKDTKKHKEYREPKETESKTQKNSITSDESDSVYANIHEKAEGIPEILAEDLCDAIADAREKEEKRNKKSKHHPGNVSFREIVIALAFGIILYWALNHARGIFAFFGSVADVFSPIIIGLCIAFVLNLVLIPIEKLWDWATAKIKHTSTVKYLSKIKRPACLVLSTLIMAGLIFGLFFIVIPELGVTIRMFADMIPKLIKNTEILLGRLSEFLAQRNITLPNILPDPEEAVKFFKDLFSEKGQQVFDVTVNVTSSVFSVLFDIVLSIVFAFYVLAQKEKLSKKIKSILYAVTEEEKADTIIRVATLSNSAFTKFVTGQFTEAIIIGVLCWIGMLILGMPYAAVISVVIGATALIPIFGAFIGAAIGAILILAVDFMQAVWFIVFIIILQQIETNLIYPRVVGKSIGLPGILVLASVTVGGAVFGFGGILLGIPVCSVIYCIFNEFVDKRIEDKGEKVAKKTKE